MNDTTAPTTEAMPTAEAAPTAATRPSFGADAPGQQQPPPGVPAVSTPVTPGPDATPAGTPPADVAASSHESSPGGPVELECPGCGTLVVGDSPRPSAEWFCPQCDFPVFWAAPPAEPASGQKRARRRLPGTGGTEVVGAFSCWHCGERNEPDTPECRRCAATLPKPLAPTPEPVRVEVRVPVPVPYVVRTVTWPFVVGGVLAGLSLGLAATLLVLRLSGAIAGGAG